MKFLDKIKEFFQNLFKRKENKVVAVTPETVVSTSVSTSVSVPVARIETPVGGETLAQYALSHGVSPSVIAAFLSVASSYPGDNAEKTDRFLNPHKYMTQEQINKEKREVDSWQGVYPRPRSREKVNGVDAIFAEGHVPTHAEYIEYSKAIGEYMIYQRSRGQPYNLYQDFGTSFFNQADAEAYGKTYFKQEG